MSTSARVMDRSQQIGLVARLVAIVAALATAFALGAASKADGGPTGIARSITATEYTGPHGPHQMPKREASVDLLLHGPGQLPKR